MDWYKDQEKPGMQVVWRNAAPPRRTRSKPRLLLLDKDTTIYITGSPDVEAVFELISGGTVGSVRESSKGGVCQHWG